MTKPGVLPRSRQGRPPSDVCVGRVAPVVVLTCRTRRAVHRDRRQIELVVRILADEGRPATTQLAAHAAAFDALEQPIHPIHHCSYLTGFPFCQQDVR